MSSAHDSARSVAILLMAAPRFFVPPPLDPSAAGSEFALPDAPAHHALRVLRLAVGDALTLFTGDGRRVRGDAGARGQARRVGAARRVPAGRARVGAGGDAGPGHRGDGRDGHDRAPRGRTGRRRASSRWSARAARGFRGGAHGDKRLAHWRQVAVAACEQCGRNRVPAVHDVADLADWLRARDATRPGVVLDPEAAASIATLAAPAQRVRPADRTRRRPRPRTR